MFDICMQIWAPNNTTEIIQNEFNCTVRKEKENECLGLNNKI